MISYIPALATHIINAGAKTLDNLFAVSIRWWVSFFLVLCLGSSSSYHLRNYMNEIVVI